MNCISLTLLVVMVVSQQEGMTCHDMNKELKENHNRGRQGEISYLVLNSAPREGSLDRRRDLLVVV